MNSQDMPKNLLELIILKLIISRLPPLHFKTLEFHIWFFNQVVQHENINKMNPYNISVTVGPNIFRPEVNTNKDLVNVSMYYELI